MEIKSILKSVTIELAECFENLQEDQIQDLEARIKAANKVFVAGAGRSLMMIRGLAMRLMHMGFTSYVVGETITPAIEPGDLLIIASGSGQTGSLCVMAEKCKKIGADLALITTNPESTIGKLADCIVEIKAVSTKLKQIGSKSVQPGANTFEQSVLLLGDAIIIDIISNKSMDDTNVALLKKHANLE